ncbi:MAG: signal peptidase I [Candidatus Roizmanbacteria bacterium]|nr:signal peptidase I [Candidatus Roizmanbacteria bacterium]
MKSFFKLLKVIAIVVVLMYGALLFFLSRQIGGYRAFVVMSASMEPQIQTGSLIITQKVNPHDLQEQDVVTFVRPDDTQEFVTHRIVSVSKPEGIPLFKTKGDNNDTEDIWTLVGGGVVGKVVTVIPKLGYALSFARTKIGIALLIIVPAFFIIIDEIKILHHLIKRKKQSIEPESTLTALLLLAFGIATFIFSESTQAVVSYSVTLANNTVTVSEQQEPTETPTPTVTPTPTDGQDTCPDVPDITIEGNGAGSHNEVEIDIECKEKTNQTNESDIENTVSVSNSGRNTATTVTINNSTNTNVATSSAQH